MSVLSPFRPHPKVAGHRPLAWYAAAMAVLAVVCVVGLAADGRTVLGHSVWLKPLKFAVSFGLYAGTLAWMVGQAARWRRTLWWLGSVTVAGFLVPEISAITLQAARGVPSHFNFATSWDATVFMVMGGAAYLGWLMTFATGVLLVAQRRVDRAMAWAIGLGFVIALAGMSVGYLMTAPTPEQAQALAHGLHPVTIGAHSVGAAGGAGAMPVTGWETGAGDLRVAHFIGLHAMQVLPLVAIVLRRLGRRFAGLGYARPALVIIAAFGYAGLTALVLWQALRGQALVRPDALTLGAAGALAALVAGASAVLLTAARRKTAPTATRCEAPTDTRRGAAPTDTRREAAPTDSRREAALTDARREARTGAHPGTARTGAHPATGPLSGARRTAAPTGVRPGTAA